MLFLGPLKFGLMILVKFAINQQNESAIGLGNYQFIPFYGIEPFVESRQRFGNAKQLVFLAIVRLAMDAAHDFEESGQ